MKDLTIASLNISTLDIPSLVEKEENIPTYGSIEAAGADVRAHLEEDVVLLPGASALIPTGLKVEIPNGYEIQVRPRSGLALKKSNYCFKYSWHN